MKAKEYYSYNFEMKLNENEGVEVDRKPLFLFSLGIVFSVLLILLGVFELFGIGQSQEKIFVGLEPSSNVNFIMSPIIFDVIIIIIGFFSFCKLLFSALKYRKIVFNDGKVILSENNIYGQKRSCIEDVNKYLGVLTRVEFIHIGFIAKNRYIIELIHKDYKKNVPLYISTSSKGLRAKWIEYAKVLKLDCIDEKEGELEFVTVKNMNKSIIEQVKDGSVVDEYDRYEYLPKTIDYVRKRDKFILKAKKFWFDIFNAFLSIVVLLACVFAIVFKLYVAVFVVLLVSSFLFAKKDKLVIKKLKLVKVDKYTFFNKKVTEIQKKDIKSVDIEYNPTTNRNYIAIYSDDNVIVFAKKMPLKDLKWLKKFLINQITRNK